MEILKNPKKALDSAMRRYLRQKSDKPIYICRATVARREFWVVLSAAELAANNISPQSCWNLVDGRHGLQELKVAHQKDAKYKLARTAIRSYQSFQKAQEKLKKMERGADAPRAEELDTTEA
ncbi:hypothetical protein M7775_02175 [Sporomusa sphaeroides DSM 2875]|uniref:hypothetical protein n=1 Tax=Sporomusa sphaeroides TaxID=47679 RepID=UPI00202E4034|nr:hypothetical protein [Sporomusa sphaeroides]MCM0757375.1 hypothetical protein [Sporomusa sphaeroides DSM 2875]